MPRTKSLATYFVILIIPCLFIYYLFTTIPLNRYSQSSPSPPSIFRPNNNQNNENNNPSNHKYGPLWSNNTNDNTITKSDYNGLFSYYKIKPLPILNEDESKDSDPIIESRRNFIKDMMKEAWNSYVKYSWGDNELQPLTRNSKLDSIFGPSPLGLTIVDSMDTLLLMNMKQEYERGREWIERSLDFKDVNNEISLFETVIRYVGGLLSLFALTGDPMFLYKTRKLADILSPAYETRTGIPNSLIIPRTGKSHHYSWAHGAILSEFGSQHLEYTYLGDMLGEKRFRDRVDRIRDSVEKTDKQNGLYHLMIDNQNGYWTENKVSLGALGDSFYEYLIKSYVQSGEQDKQALKMYIDAMEAIDRSGIINQSYPSHLTYISDLEFGKPNNKMQHLTCFAGGMYMLGYHHLSNGNKSNLQSLLDISNIEQLSKRHFDLAVNVTETCYQSYHRTPTHLGPEVFYFDENNEAINRNGAYYILRPEVIESYFVLWRFTHDKRYRDYAWEAAQAIHKHCRTGHGYCGLRNVMIDPPIKDNTQQSFFLSETLKYLYLIFSNDNLIPLDRWVFNTEAHPLPICGANPSYPFETCNHYGSSPSSQSSK